MEINRNQYFMIGLVVLLLGIQFKVVDTFVLNESASKVIAERLNKPGPMQTAAPTLSVTDGLVPQRQEWQPPKWIGWVLISVGVVLVLHSLAMRKPGG